jgi:prefoldin subunit 5
MNRAVITLGDNFEVRIIRLMPGSCELQVEINDQIVGRVPFDNVVKARTRVDPDHASEPEKQIAALRAEVSALRSRELDFQTARQQINVAMEREAKMKAERDAAVSELSYVRSRIESNKENTRLDALEQRIKQLAQKLERTLTETDPSSDPVDKDPH